MAPIFDMARIFGAALESAPQFGAQLASSALAEYGRVKQTKEQLGWQKRERERLIDLQAKQAMGQATATTRRGNVMESTLGGYLQHEAKQAKEQIQRDYERDVKATRIFGLF